MIPIPISIIKEKETVKVFSRKYFVEKCGKANRYSLLFFFFFSFDVIAYGLFLLLLYN